MRCTPLITRFTARQNPSHCLYQSILKEFLCGTQVAVRSAFRISIERIPSKKHCSQTHVGHPDIDPRFADYSSLVAFATLGQRM